MTSSKSNFYAFYGILHLFMILCDFEIFRVEIRTASESIFFIIFKSISNELSDIHKPYHRKK